MDYYASCPPNPSDPTILAITIATSFRNAAAGSNLSLSLRWHPPATAPPSEDPYAYSAANMPRFSLEGVVERVEEEREEDANENAKERRKGNGKGASSELEECFFARHPDARAWAPGNEIHESWWGRLVVKGVYWIGGFGDRAYIGWIPVEEWVGVTDEEIEAARLVGEEGYRSNVLERGWEALAAEEL